MSINAYQLFKDVGFSESRITKMLPRIKSQSYATDQVVWFKGDEQPSFTYIFHGMVCVSKPCGDGVRHPVTVFGEGAWFGEAGFINRQTRISRFDYICLAPTRLISIPFDEAVEAFEQEAEFARYVARLSDWRGQKYAEMLMLMRTGSAALRVVMGLAMLTEALIDNSSHLPGQLLEDHLEIPLKQSLVSSMCGVSRGILSHYLQQLTASGWLQVNYGTIEVRSVKSWLVFLTAHRQNSQNTTKSSMHDILELMQIASTTVCQAAKQHCNTNENDGQCQTIGI